VKVRVTVCDLHQDNRREFVGRPKAVTEELVAAYPWLKAPRDAGEDLAGLVEILEATAQFLVAELEAMSEGAE
jgi:hypothetical protein